ncbi:MAG: hypothetical protein LBL30_02550 [Holosporales bacterium]|nr:hypothetical protein [Holosporales bacterium]
MREATTPRILKNQKIRAYQIITQAMGKTNKQPYSKNQLREIARRLKDRITAKEVAEKYITSKIIRHGSYYMTNCQFHDDQNPSMRITNGYFRCFACDEEGYDIITFIRKLKNCNFHGACEVLARDFSIDIELKRNCSVKRPTSPVRDNSIPTDSPVETVPTVSVDENPLMLETLVSEPDPNNSNNQSTIKQIARNKNYTRQACSEPDQRQQETQAQEILLKAKEDILRRAKEILNLAMYSPINEPNKYLAGKGLDLADFKNQPIGQTSKHEYIHYLSPDKKSICIPKGSFIISASNLNYELKSIQYITPYKNKDGKDKWFLPLIKVEGLFFPLEGKTENIVLCEGPATALTINKLISYKTLCCFSSTNLNKVYQNLLKLYSRRKIHR